MELSDCTQTTVREAASANGYTRVAQRFVAETNQTYTTWQHDDGTLYGAVNTQAMPQPLQWGMNARAIGFFARECPLCGVAAEWLAPTDLSDAAVTDIFPAHKMATVGIEGGKNAALAHVAGPGELSSLAITHDVDCLARPEGIVQMIERGGN